MPGSAQKMEAKTEIQFEMDEIENALLLVIHRTNVNMFMRYVQYILFHYRIATQQELVKMYITQDDKCSFW